MSSESLRLAEFHLDMIKYGKEKFGVSMEPITSTSVAVERVEPQAAMQSSRLGENILLSTAADLDHVVHQKLVLSWLIELFGAPDASSPLVLSTFALLKAHEQRLGELLEASELRLRQILEQVRGLEQERLHLLEKQETAVERQIMQLGVELTQLDAPESELGGNMLALTGDFAHYADPEAVGSIKSSAARKRNKLMAKIIGAHDLRQLIKTQKTQMINGLAQIVSSWRQIDIVCAQAA